MNGWSPLAVLAVFVVLAVLNVMTVFAVFAFPADTQTHRRSNFAFRCVCHPNKHLDTRLPGHTDSRPPGHADIRTHELTDELTFALAEMNQTT